MSQAWRHSPSPKVEGLGVPLDDLAMGAGGALCSSSSKSNRFTSGTTATGGLEARGVEGTGLEERCEEELARCTLDDAGLALSSQSPASYSSNSPPRAEVSVNADDLSRGRSSRLDSLWLLFPPVRQAQGLVSMLRDYQVRRSSQDDAPSNESLPNPP